MTIKEHTHDFVILAMLLPVGRQVSLQILPFWYNFWHTRYLNIKKKCGDVSFKTNLANYFRYFHTECAIQDKN